MPRDRDEPLIEESTTNNWTEYRRLVMSILKRNGEEIERLEEDLKRIELNFSLDISKLQTKAAIFGAGCGIVGAAVVDIIVRAFFK